METNLEQVMQTASAAFNQYKTFSGKQKATFLYAIAEEILDSSEALIQQAKEETNISEAQLAGELKRAVFQWHSFARLLEEGSWVDARIDLPNSARLPVAKPDVRKMLIPIGVVGVFGASNFPFAYSTIGGDTASALAAGCSVVVKGHPAHPLTSRLSAELILKAAQRTEMPEGVFVHVEGIGFEIGKALVMHPVTKAIGFTGSLRGGRALFDMANQRPEPIPVFAEMGSINPVILMPQKLKREGLEVANRYVQSITAGMGQFCTNPGLLIGIEGEGLNVFVNELASKITEVAPAAMLNAGIYQNYEGKRTIVTSQEGVHIEGESQIAKSGIIQAIPTFASVDAQTFLSNPTLHQEVFGPFSLLVKCQDKQELQKVLDYLEGQISCTIMATDEELAENPTIIQRLREISGRLVFNGVPTGVEVGFAMQHGGPYPASTDGRFGAVGQDSIKRFVRPATYQNCPDFLLPDELKNDNPLGIWRMVDNVLTR